MVSELEQLVAKLARKVLDPLPEGAAIEDSEDLRAAFGALEFYIPEIINEVHPDGLELDGFQPSVKEKTGANEILLCGSAWMYVWIKGQVGFRTIPFHLRLQIHPTADEVTWLECRLGERSEEGIKQDSDLSLKKLAILTVGANTPDSIEEIDWFYKVNFGERRVQQ